MTISPKTTQTSESIDERRTRPILRWLTRPPDSVPESVRPQGQLLLYLLLFLILSLLLILLIILPIPTFRNSEQPSVFIALILLLSVAYGLTRTKHYAQAAMFTVSVTAVSVWVFAFTDNVNVDFFAKDLFYVVISIILSSLVLPVRVTVFFAVVHMGAMILTGIFLPELMILAELINLLIFVSMISILVILAAILRRHDQEEIQRQSFSLRQSEERFHLVSYATNDVVWDWDLSTGHVWRNHSLQRLFGFEAEQVRPEIEWWYEQIHPEDRDKVVKSIQAAIDGGSQFWSKEYRHQCADGSYVYVFDRGYIIHNQDGKPIRMLGAILDINARKQAEEVLRQESVHDPLTGLYNRRYMEEMLQREMRRAERNHQPISIIMLDIDHFKDVNDTLGHAAGDALLRKLSAFLLKNFRGADIACRYGGDEFVIILPNTSLDVAHQRAENLCASAKELSVDFHHQFLGALTLSMGVAMFPTQGVTGDAILQAADTALYAAKDAGRNRVVAAHP
jgi:diguanylate cyclase (GGDEF)-like protein/PAS domain S-box-containing protein